MESSLAKAYDPSSFEESIYRQWESCGAFTADAHSDKKSFTIAMPPPNATGVLHIGHAVMLAIEDILIRWHRMLGDEVLWIPGTDHAAIATETVVLNKIKAEEKISDPRAVLGREEVLRRIQNYVSESKSVIRSQIRALGSSCDWSRERYTLDASLNRCVNETFIRMFQDGLIYRGLRIVNWDPSLQTTVSDDEIIHEEVSGILYYIQYGPFVIASSRPETKLGDTAIAVHPSDDRYQSYIGQTLDVQWPKGQIITVKVIADYRVDPQFGTGALGVTPAHSAMDFAMAQDHGIPLIAVINEAGRMTDVAGAYAGMKVLECRQAFVEDLRTAGLLVKEVPYQQPLSICYRSKQPIEPLLKEQWFINVQKPVVLWKGKLRSLKDILADVVSSGDIQILPDRFQGTYFHWVENLQDWCVSRQIWWGHRIPIWYQGSEIQVSMTSPGPQWTQDPDTLDTWFSSALWTWSTLIEPEKALDPRLSFDELLQQSPDFQKFHPTQVMETGYDILFFWVARMVLMTTYMIGKIPFETVYLHGMVRTKDGKKMSKSDPKNCVDPLESIQQYGTDALRLALITGTGPGMDLKIYPEKLESSRRFVNKLWNAGRYVLMSIPNTTPITPPMNVLSPLSQWMLHRLNQLIQSSQKGLEEFRLSHTIDDLRSFVWGDFCDWYLEMAKSPEQTPEDYQVLAYGYTTLLKLLHPYIPFVTEALWQSFPTQGLLIQSSWPQPIPEHHYPQSERQITLIQQVITEIRALREKAKLGLNITIKALVESLNAWDVLQTHRSLIERLGRLEELTLVHQEPKMKEEGLQSYIDGVRIQIDAPLVNREEALQSLLKKREKEIQFLESTQKKLSNPGFLSKAPPPVIEELQEKVGLTQKTVEALDVQIKELTA